MNIVLFEDAAVEKLSPVTLLRPAYTIACGGLRLVDLAQAMGGVQGIVRPQLVEFQSDYFSASFDPTEPTLFLNARLAPDSRLVPRLMEKCSDSVNSQSSWCAAKSGVTVAAFTTPESTPNLTSTDGQTVADYLSCQLPASEMDASLFNYPHEIVGAQSELMARNLEFRIRWGSYQEVAERVYAPSEMAGRKLPGKLRNNVVFETDSGPILLEDDVSVGPFSVLRGPIYLGHGTSVSPHTLLKGPVCVGHTCKVGGEVSNAIIEPFSNKVHYGYLGASYVGCWVNLGAGTTNSNLKNTYGTIRVAYDNEKVDTGLQFLGCVIGDFTKTAINTSIYTGKILGACSNVYGTVTTNVPSFANYARSFGEVTQHPAEVMKVTQQRVFSRRNLVQEPKHLALLQTVFEQESGKRKLADEPPSL